MSPALQMLATKVRFPAWRKWSAQDSEMLSLPPKHIQLDFCAHVLWIQSLLSGKLQAQDMEGDRALPGGIDSHWSARMELLPGLVMLIPVESIWFSLKVTGGR